MINYPFQFDVVCIKQDDFHCRPSRIVLGDEVCIKVIVCSVFLVENDRKR